MKRVKVGVIGCGNISAAYLKASKTFPILDLVALSDMNPRASAARAAEFGIPARSVEETLADPEIEIILNLNCAEGACRGWPSGHRGRQACPLGKTARRHCRGGPDTQRGGEGWGLRLGCAPDTFLSGAQQRARQCVDDGLIGAPVGGTAFFMCPGHERWHRARPSIISPAAARCSTWDPIT